MLARFRFAVPLDRIDVRSSPAGNPNHTDSQFPVILYRNKLCCTCWGNPDTKQRSTFISSESFVMASALCANGRPRREQP